FFHPSYVLRASPSCSLISFFLLHHPAPTHIYTLSLHDALPIFQCDLFIPDHRWFLLVSLFRPPQHRLNPAQDKRHGKGLDNIVICQDIKALHLAGVIVPCRQHDDRRPAFFPQDLANCKSVNLRQHQIQQHQVRITSPECLNPFQTVTGTIYCISCILQERLDDVLDSCFVFYNQNCLCHNSTSAIWTTVYHTKMEFWWSSLIFHTDFKLFIVFHFLRKNPRSSFPWDIYKFVSNSPHGLDIFFFCNLPQLLADIPDDTKHRTAHIHRFLLPDCPINLLLCEHSSWLTGKVRQGVKFVILCQRNSLPLIRCLVAERVNTESGILKNRISIQQCLTTIQSCQDLFLHQTATFCRAKYQFNQTYFVQP